MHRASCLCSNGSMDRGKRILSIDYGEKNIGLACSDELGLTVQPLPSIPNAGRRNFVRKLRTMVQSLSIQELVLGIPVNMDGTQGGPALRMEEMVEGLQRALKIPATGVEERLSTVEALEFWQKMSPRRQKRYRTVDSLAAALILERYLREK